MPEGQGGDVVDPAAQRLAEKEVYDKIYGHLHSLGDKGRAKFEKDLIGRLRLETGSLASKLLGNKHTAPSMIAGLVIIMVFITIIVIVIFRPDNIVLISTLTSLAGTALGVVIGRHF